MTPDDPGMQALAEALLGGEEPTPRALADALRGRESLGELGMAGGEWIRAAAAPVLQGARGRLGQENARQGALLKRALWGQGRVGETPLDTRLLDLAPDLNLDRNALAAMPPKQASNIISQRLAQRAADADKEAKLRSPEAAAAAAEKKAREDEERAREAEEAAIRLAKGRLEVVKVRRDLSAKPGEAAPKAGPRMTDRTKDDLNTMANTAEAVSRLRDEFKDDYAGGGLIGGAKVAGAKALGSWAPEDTQSAAAFWADWDKLINLPERNAIFGASLSAGEKSSWEGARNIKPGADPKLVRRKLDELLAITRKKGKALADSAIAEGYNADAVAALTRGAFDAPAAGAATAPAPGAPAGRVRRYNPATGRLE